MFILEINKKTTQMILIKKEENENKNINITSFKYLQQKIFSIFTY